MNHKESNVLHSYRCHCGKLLFRGLLLDSTVQIKCKKCGELMSFQGSSDLVAPDGSFAMMLDRQANIVSASSNIQDLFGYSLSELLTKSYGELIPQLPEGAPQIDLTHLWELPHKERYYFKSKVTHRQKDGKIIPGIAQSKFVKTSSDVALFNVFRPLGTDEVTSGSEPEFFALREYPFFLQIDTNGVCIDASTARRRPYSRPRDEIVGKPFVTFMHESVAEREAFMKQLHRGEPFELIGKKFDRVNGTPVRMDAFFTPNFTPSGVCTDYTVYIFNHGLLSEHERQFTLAPGV